MLLSQIEVVAIAASRSQAKDELKRIYKAFVNEQYYNAGGQARPIGPYGKRWRQVKIRKHWSMKRGQANGRLARAVGNESVIRPTPTGYRLDLSRADKIVRRYTNRGNPNSFVASKAPGLMNMQEGWQERHLRAIRKACAPLLGQLRGVTKKLGIADGEVRMNVNLRLNPAIEAAARHNRFGVGQRMWNRVGVVQNRGDEGRFQGVRGFRYGRT